MEQEIQKKWYIKVWLEGKCLDLWSLNHTFFGASMAGLFILISVPFWISLLISFIAMVAWEFWEHFRRIHESLCNKIFDVLTGLLGFFIVHNLVEAYAHEVGIFVFIIIFYIALELWGCWAFRKIGRHFI